MKLHPTLTYLLVAVAGSALNAGEQLEKFQPDKRKLTLEETIELALRQNPTILNAKHEIERTRGQVITVRAQALPHLVLTSQYDEEQKSLVQSAATTGGLSSSQASASGSQSGASLPQDKSWYVALQVQQILYSGSVGPAIRAAKLTQDNSIFSLRDTIDTVVDTTRKQFYDVLLNSQLIDVQQEALRLLENQLTDQVNRFDAGTVPRFNVLQAEVAVANQRPVLIRAKITYSISLLTLAKTLGLQYSEAHPSQPLEALGDLEVHPQKIDLNDAIATAKADRPFLKVQRQNMLIQAENVKVQRAGYQPTIQANGGYEGRNLSSNDLSNVVRGWFLGVTGTWNIFDGGATYGNVKQARAQLEEAKVTYDDSVHQVELEVQQAVDNLQQAKETLESQLKTVEQALEAVRLAQERLNAGAGVQLDVLNAQVALTQARSTVLQAQHDYLSAQADFEKATATATKYDELFDDPLVKKARSKKNQ